MKRLTYLLVAILAMTAVLAGCGGTDTPSETTGQPTDTASMQPSGSAVEPETEAPTGEASAPAENTGGKIEFTDMTGQAISLDKPAEKAIALNPADCEIIYALGAGDILVGRGEYCDYPAEVADVEAVQSGENTNIEMIINLKPDVIFMSTMAQTPEHVTQLQDAGIVVVSTESADIEGVYTAIDIIGKAVGKDEEAVALIDDMKSSFDEIKAKVEAGDEKKTIYFEVSPLEFDLWAAGSGTFMDEIATMLGLENIFADVDNWAQVSQEQVIERNPDYIVTITMYMGEGPQPEEEIKGRSGWDAITAVKDNNIFLANSDELSRPGPRLVDGANALFDFIY